MGTVYRMSQEAWDALDRYSRTLDRYSLEIGLQLDRALNVGYYPVALVSCLFFVFIYKVVSPNISHSLFPRYRGLTPTEAIDWNTRVVSNVHALIVSALCIHELLFDVGIRQDPIWCESCLVRSNCAVVVGYLFADLIIMIWNWSYIGEFFFVTHHLAVIYGYYYVMSYGVLPWFANFRLMAELSTPFVNQRWFFDVLGLKKTKGYAINGVLLFTSFLFVRILPMPVYYYRLYSIYDIPAFTDMGVVRHTALLTCLLLDAINVFWFSKIFKGAKKLYLAQKALQPSPDVTRGGFLSALGKRFHRVSTPK